ncbi:RagB/SusD family nutrient uptake outer membrane protein [Epilithonimonas mollis]|uniref:SusD family protein n=1 Tax=Epilithonimonas mollis TaxID=216903 RepID=A0A1M6R9K2_9FLAO|nr:RagB/SusD family nutrient uptake outer membrane protein [Epilithonimonas mollis]SHK29155.1 SusD family protein [Epilithonimonas mollis]
MKKYIKTITAAALLIVSANSCSDKELELLPPDQDLLELSLNNEEQLQQFLNRAYFSMSSASAFGTDILVYGDLLSDHINVVTPAPTSFTNLYTLTYSGLSSDFGFYRTLYDAIAKCNLIINNTKVEDSENVSRIKAEAKIIRGFAYFTLVNFFSPTPTSGVNQEYGVPLLLENYDATLQKPRASIAEVYNQIISDLTDGANNAGEGSTENKVTLTRTAAKLLLSRVYLTRRANGDAQLALQYASDVVENSPSGIFAPVNSSTQANYVNYFTSSNDDISENQPETIWELDMTSLTSTVNGIGANKAISGYYDRVDSRKCLMFTRSFYDALNSTTDVRKGLFSTASGGNTPSGVWTTKFPRLSSGGNYTRNNKILRFAEAELNQIEAYYLTGQTQIALTKLNSFAQKRKGTQYTGSNLLDDILKEREKEFFAEGYRFFDLKRYSLPLVKNANCTINCNVPANDKLFVMPMNQDALNYNLNLKQYPGY